MTICMCESFWIHLLQLLRTCPCTLKMMFLTDQEGQVQSVFLLHSAQGGGHTCRRGQAECEKPRVVLPILWWAPTVYCFQRFPMDFWYSCIDLVELDIIEAVQNIPEDSRPFKNSLIQNASCQSCVPNVGGRRLCLSGCRSKKEQLPHNETQGLLRNWTLGVHSWRRSSE